MGSRQRGDISEGPRPSGSDSRSNKGKTVKRFCLSGKRGGETPEPDSSCKDGEANTAPCRHHHVAARSPGRKASWAILTEPSSPERFHFDVTHPEKDCCYSDDNQGFNRRSFRN